MNFTREPLIETVITPKEGYKLVIRNSKGGGQEEYFVDAVEVISFGNATFFRSFEKPKCFLVPVNDYEVLEVRESRMVLKTSGMERGIKIAGGREAPVKVQKEEPVLQEVEMTAEQRVDKRRERRRHRKKRGGGYSEQEQESADAPEIAPSEQKEKKGEKPSLIPPPSTLISETISRYKALQEPEISKEIQEEPEIFQEEEDQEIPF